MNQYLNNLIPESLKPYFSKYGLAISLTAAAVLLIVLVLLLRSPMMDVEETPEFGDLPDFASISDVKEMKAAFYDYLQPMVDYHNGRIMKQRAQLQALYAKLKAGDDFNSDDKEFVTALAEQYEFELTVGWDNEMTDDINKHIFSTVYRQLILKIDEIPIDLALVQAAKESGWGRSRFAVEGNNLFGQWCYKPGCGLVPGQRNEGATHEVQKFDSVSDAIRSYMNNLNSNPSYETLWLIRAGLRSADFPISGAALADGLIKYSERRQAYVDEVKSMIRQYHKFKAAIN